MTRDEKIVVAKSYFSEIFNANKMINRLDSVAADLRRDLGRSHRRSNSGARSGSGKNSNSFATAVDRVVDIEAEIDRRIDALVGMKQDGLARIYKVDGALKQNILIARYIQFKSWDSAAEELHYDRKYLQRTGKAALAEFADKNQDILQIARVADAVKRMRVNE